MSVNWKGEVQLCCMDYDSTIKLGNLNHETVGTVWRNKKIADIRRVHQTGQINSMEICRSCTLPEKKYFSFFTIFISTFVNSWLLRVLMPYYEKAYIFSWKLFREKVRLDKAA